MAHASAVLALVNQSQQSNSSLVSDWSSRSLEYSDAELVLLGVAMAILVLAIVFGKLQNISGFKLVCWIKTKIFLQHLVSFLWIYLFCVQVTCWWLQPSCGSSGSRRSPTSSLPRWLLPTSSWVWLWSPLAPATSCWGPGNSETSCVNSGLQLTCCV